VVYYPFVSFSGYFLSETPYTLLITASALAALRLADSGRSRYAWYLGLALAAAFWVRPQILTAIVMLGAFALWRRRGLPRVRLAHWAFALMPVLLVLGLSAWWVERHTGHFGLGSTNGPLNRVFGRCHNPEMKGTDYQFGVPMLGRLEHWSKRDPNGFLQLDPARERMIIVQHSLADAAPLDAIAEDCMRRTGPWRQLRYALTHVVMLWADVAWPDGGIRRYFPTMRFATRVHAIVLLLPLLVALMTGLSEQNARRGLVAIFVWSMVVVAMVVFGCGRVRAVHDGLIVALACDTYGRLVAWWRARKAAARPAAPVSNGVTGEAAAPAIPREAVTSD
jgi:hypothetical protein